MLTRYQARNVLFGGWCYRGEDGTWQYVDEQIRAPAQDRKVLLVSDTTQAVFECIVEKFDAKKGWELEGYNLDDDCDFIHTHLPDFLNTLQQVFLACHADGTPLPPCDEWGVNPVLDYE
jgi:hypothetical protein